MTSTTTRPVRPSAAVEPRPGPLGRLADLTYRHRLLTVLAWVAALGLSVVLAGAFGGEFKADYSAPGSDSSAAQQLLEDEFPAQSGDTVDVVVRTDGPATAAAVRTDVGPCWRSSPPCRTWSASTTRTRTPGGISPDGRTLVAHAQLDVVNPPDMPVADSEQMLEVADAASRPG